MWRHERDLSSQGGLRKYRLRLCMAAVLLCSCSIGILVVPGFFARDGVQMNELALSPRLSSSDRMATARAQAPGHGQIDLPAHSSNPSHPTLPSAPPPVAVPVPIPGLQPPLVPTTPAAPSTPPSGQAMPVGDLPGWHQIFADDFNMPAPLGSFPGGTYGQNFTVYPDGTPDTAGQKGAPSRYEPSQVVSINNGILNEYLHTANGTPMAVAILPDLPGNHLYGKYTVRFRSDALQGFKTAWLLWPDSGNWPHDGEIDFPENDLTQPINGFVHHMGASSGSDQTAFSTTVMDTSWHTASIEWLPGLVNFILDGNVIGTTTDSIPSTPMHWVLQTEACFNGCPSASVAGNLQIDWVTAYAPA